MRGKGVAVGGLRRRQSNRAGGRRDRESEDGGGARALPSGARELSRHRDEKECGLAEKKVGVGELGGGGRVGSGGKRWRAAGLARKTRRAREEKKNGGARRGAKKESGPWSTRRRGALRAGLVPRTRLERGRRRRRMRIAAAGGYL